MIQVHTVHVLRDVITQKAQIRVSLDPKRTIRAMGLGRDTLVLHYEKQMKFGEVLELVKFL